MSTLHPRWRRMFAKERLIPGLGGQFNISHARYAIIQDIPDPAPVTIAVFPRTRKDIVAPGQMGW